MYAYECSWFERQIHCCTVYKRKLLAHVYTWIHIQCSQILNTTKSGRMYKRMIKRTEVKRQDNGMPCEGLHQPSTARSQTPTSQPVSADSCRRISGCLQRTIHSAIKQPAQILVIYRKSFVHRNYCICHHCFIHIHHFGLVAYHLTTWPTQEHTNIIYSLLILRMH